MSKIHQSWNNLEPTSREQQGSINDLNEYIKRITENFCFKKIPRDWYRFICNCYYIKSISQCCSWINHETVKFTIEEWSYNDLMKVNFISHNDDNYYNYMNEIPTWSEEEIKDCNHNSCARHIPYWQINGTWEALPFVVKLAPSIKKNLPITNKNSLYLLIEGYSRFGMLKRFKENQKINLLDRHKVYLIT